MPRDYVIGIGGTGARCVEAIIYLAAAGLFERPLHILLVDPDQNNGNANRTKKLVAAYHQLQLCEQPQDAKQRRLLGEGRSLSKPTIFRVALNKNEIDPAQQFPYFWQDPNDPDRTFGMVINYNRLTSEMHSFIDLFYEEEDLHMKLGKGYRGRPNIGSVALISDLRNTMEVPGKGLHEFKSMIETDARQNEFVRVFICGSVFGGTGAAGLPTAVELLKSVHDSQKLRFGCAMMTPYFTFADPEKGEATDGPTPDGKIHQVATQAALLHYAQSWPGYQHVYVVGAPNLVTSKAGHQVGGGDQENDSHYAEIMAALGARDFFSMDAVEAASRELHYVDGQHFGFATLPAQPAEKDRGKEDQNRIKHLLLNFTTFAYLYKNILYQDLKNRHWYASQAWYKDNFTEGSLDNQGQLLDALENFSSLYLTWLSMIGEPIKEDDGKPFNWSALLLTGADSEKQLGRLSSAESDDEPRYVNESYGQIMTRLHALRPVYTNTPHPIGLLMYLLYEAVSRFCEGNYLLANRRQ